MHKCSTTPWVSCSPSRPGGRLPRGLHPSRVSYEGLQQPSGLGTFKCREYKVEILIFYLPPEILPGGLQINTTLCCLKPNHSEKLEAKESKEDGRGGRWQLGVKGQKEARSCCKSKTRRQPLLRTYVPSCDLSPEIETERQSERKEQTDRLRESSPNPRPAPFPGTSETRSR